MFAEFNKLSHICFFFNMQQLKGQGADLETKRVTECKSNTKRKR